ncbi:MAG: hypothetical protein K6T51_08750 [Rubrobacteraceae bacterium]|nr:hypothetical protein [Rubrobacteraceae bacterium]
MNARPESRRRARWLPWLGAACVTAALVLALLYALMGTTSGPAESRARGIEEARAAAQRYLRTYGDHNLRVSEVMDFVNNYYVEVRERDTGIGAMELLVDKQAMRVHPEPGPNMMWNTKYGMMERMAWDHPPRAYEQTSAGDDMPVSPDRARKIADRYLARVSPETRATEPEKFYGYYTLHTVKGGRITGMLSVNGYTGSVWYHGWHGRFIAMEGYEEQHHQRAR